MVAQPFGFFFALAQAAPPPTQRILMWSAVMVGLLLVAWVVITIVRRRHKASAMAEEAPSFSISSLRQMHEDGKLSDEEYERAREVIIARAKGAMDKSPLIMPRRSAPPSNGGEGEDDNLGPELLGPDDKGPPPTQPPEDSGERGGK